MSPRMNALALIIGLWFLILVLALIFPNAFPEFTLFAFPLIWELMAIPLVILSLCALIQERDKFYPILAILIVIIIFLTSLDRGYFWGAKAHFYLNGSKYEAIVSKVLAAQDFAEREKICPHNETSRLERGCWILSDETVRVSIPYTYVFLFWYDFIYDPTGVVDRGDIDTLRELSDSFSLSSAEHLLGDWYLAPVGY